MRRVGVLALVALAIAGWLGFRYIASLDRRLVAPTIPGLYGLASYVAGDYARAAHAYRWQLRTELAQWRGPVDTAQASLINGDLARARAEAEARRRDDLGAVVTLGEIALAENRAADALALFEQVLERRKDQADASLLGSVALARLGRYPEAMDMLDAFLRHGYLEERRTPFLTTLETIAALSAMDAQARPHALLASYHRYLRIFDRAQGAVAIRHARRAIAAGDHPDRAHLTIGIVETKRARWDAAMVEFRKATHLNPRNAEAWRWASVVYSRRGDLANEARTARTAADAAPDDAFYARKWHTVIAEKLGDYPTAVAFNEARLRRRPNDAIAWYNLADVHRLAGDDARSIDGFRRAAALAPDDHLNFLMLGRAYLGTGQPAEAMRHLERSLVLSPGEGATYSSIAAAHRAMGRPVDAIAAYELSFTLRPPEHADDLLPLCHLFNETGAFERAEACVNDALMRDQRNQTAHRLLRDIAANLTIRQARR